MEIDPVGIIIWLAIGALAGWLAGLLMKGAGFGLVGNIIVGIIGAFVGGLLMNMFGASLGAGLVGTVATAVIGAVVLLFGISLVKRAT